MIGDRIRELRMKAKLSQRRLNDLAGLPKSTVSQLESGNIRSTSPHNLQRLAETLNTTMYYLTTGKHDRRMFVSNVGETIPLKKIPVLSFVQAGKLTETLESISADSPVDWLYTAEKVSEKTFALDVVGDSMSPTFAEGDRLIVDPSIAPRAGDYVIATNDKHEATFKRYKQLGVSSNGTEIFELVPLNEFYASYRSDETPLAIVGVVISYSRRVRR